MIHLVELQPVDPRTDEVKTLRYSTAAFTTEPTDAPANTSWDDRLVDAGNYERFLFGRGRSRGVSEVGGGDIVVQNADRALDDLLELAWDGRPVTIYALASRASPWSSRQVVFQGTTEQVEFSGRTVLIRIRDRLALLRDAIQPARYLGTTINGGLAFAEGGADMKDVRKPLLWGCGQTIPAILVDAFDRVYQVSSRAISAVTAVRAGGVQLTATQDYPTLAALKAASITGGRYATCLALGLVRLGAAAGGTLTVDANEGAALSDRSAARIAQRMLAGIASVVSEDFDALHALNPAECGFYIAPGETTTLSAVSTMLASIGGWLCPDRLGRFRVGRLDLPTGAGSVARIDRSLFLRSDSISRSAPLDEGAGVPARSVTVRYGRSWYVFAADALKDVATDDPFRARAMQEWRLAKVASARNQTLYPKGPEIVVDSCLINEADAMAEAARLMPILGQRRDVIGLRVPSSEIPAVDLNKEITLVADRFGMSAGAALRVTGLTESRKTGMTTIEAWR